MRDLHAHRGPKILLGVSYALWDLADRKPGPLPGTIVMETGGMKGRPARNAPRGIPQDALCGVFGAEHPFGVRNGRADVAGLFSRRRAVPDAALDARSDPRLNDPFAWAGSGRSGGINVIDLANVYSCSFLQTQDFGKAYDDGTFRIEGRITGSEIRGCNLLVQ